VLTFDKDCDIISAGDMMHTKNILWLITFVIISLTFFSCSSIKTEDGTETMDYNILTQMELLNNGESVKTINIVKNETEVDLKINYRSDISFELEIGMIDNYSQRDFYMKKDDKWLNDKTFVLDLPNSNGEFVEAHYKIKVDNLNYQHHDIIWYIKNNTKIQHDSMRVFSFLRLGINTASNDVFQISDEAEVVFSKNTIESPSFEIMAIESNEKDLLLQFNISLIYYGEHFVNEYNAHLKDDIPFAVMALDENGIVTFDLENSYFISNSKIGEDGYINIPKLQSETKQITYILVPYICQTDYEELERYQKIAYNNVCYYQYIQSSN